MKELDAEQRSLLKSGEYDEISRGDTWTLYRKGCDVVLLHGVDNDSDRLVTFETPTRAKHAFTAITHKPQYIELPSDSAAN
jgi:hypothetical protein